MSVMNDVMQVKMIGSKYNESSSYRCNIRFIIMYMKSRNNTVLTKVSLCRSEFSCS